MLRPAVGTRDVCPKMSDLLKEFTAFSERLEHFILSFSAKTNLVNVRVDSKILRWSKKPNLGDFSVAAAVADRLKIKDSKVFSDALLKESLHWPLPIDTCALTEQGALGFKLHRPSIFKKVLNGVVLEGDNYGRFAGKGADVTPVGVGIISSSLARVETGDIASQVDQDLTLGQLRGLLLTEHLSALLKTAGFQVSRLTPATYSSEILDRFGIKPFDTCGTEATASRELKTETQDRLVSIASRCKFRTDNPRSKWQEGMNSDQRSSEDIRAGQADCTFRDGDPKAARLLNRADISLDLHQFILDEKLPLGKSGYDKNLQKVKVVLPDGSPSPILMQCSFIEDSLSQTNPEPSHVIHVASQGSCFQQQQAALAWRLCSTRASAETIHQHHLTHGLVTARKAESKGREDIGAAELLQVREMQTREASVLKYGEEVQGEGWDQLIRRLAIAGLKFEILGKQCGHMLKVELSNSRNSSTWPDSRDGVFVMYNYARLCTLFSRFEEEVAKGTYPPLPDIASLDFGLLREDQEWGLLFHYVLQYPVMLSECVADLLQTRGPHISIHTHRVCGFLVSLCRDLSSYYSHTHVLGNCSATCVDRPKKTHSLPNDTIIIFFHKEPRPHLVPVMFARLHLLKGVQQILKNGLSLLNIQPLSQM